MPKTRPPYPPQLRARLIELARSGRAPEELGRQFEPSAQTIRNWLKQADRDESAVRDSPRGPAPGAGCRQALGLVSLHLAGVGPGSAFAEDVK